MSSEKKVLVVLGHPKTDSFNGTLADFYAKGAADAGHEIRRLNLGELDFELSFKSGYAERMALELDLQKAQELITWANHLVFVFPAWWNTGPAVLKGFIDRVFLPDFAFSYKTGSYKVDQLLAGRSARVIVTTDAPGWFYHRFMSGLGFKMMSNSVLRFCGVKPVRTTAIGSVKKSSPEQKKHWLEQMKQLGSKAK